jgi:hypothetical protein
MTRGRDGEHPFRSDKVVGLAWLLIPEQAAHRFRDDAARLFRLIAARHSD